VALPQIGIGTPTPVPVFQRQIRVKVDPTGVTGFTTSATFNHGVMADRPIIDALPDILAFVGIRPGHSARLDAATNKSKIKVLIDSDKDGAADDAITDYGKTWLEHGVRDGDTVKLADAP
jgi:Fe-S cluster assembly iron-binding protein IscA